MGMTVVYIDLLFLLNGVANYLLLLAGGRMSGAVLRRGFIALAAALGAAYAAALFLPGLEWMTAWPCKLAVGVLMSVIAYGVGRQLLRGTVMFFGASAALAGLVLAAQQLGSGPLTLENGVLYSQFDLRLLLVLFVLCYFILSLFFRRLGRHGGGELVRLEVCLLGKTVRLTALRDTGNTLTDPADDRPVVVVEYAALKPYLPDEADPNRPVDSVRRLDRAGVKGSRLLPYRAVGTELGILLALRAESVTAEGKALGALLVALSPGPVSDGGGYQALIGGM
jgi:stage II sporulation protein GA (sporulation sigma-E factor processing peptidase)